MSLFRVLRHLLLVLALVAGGGAPGFAHELAPAEPVAAQMPCHDMDSEPVAAEAAADRQDDCCQGLDCGCDCLQPVTAGLVALRPLLPVQHASRMAEFATASHAPARALPHTRPPIA